MNKENNNISFINIAQVLWKHKTAIIITGIISAILGAIVAFIVPVYYRSTAVIYPPAIAYIEATEKAYYSSGNINEFGDIEAAEQVLELFNSNDFKNKVIDGMGLYEHYGIEPGVPSSKYYMAGMYAEYISASRSRFSAVKITVVDENPVKAKEIADFIILNLNDFRNEVISNRIKSNERVLFNQKDSLRKVYNYWNDSLATLKELGIVGTFERASILRAMGTPQGSNPKVQESLENNIKYGHKYDVVEAELLEQQRLLDNINEVLLQWRANADKAASQQFIVEHPQVPDRRFKPKRTIILITVVGASLLLLMFYLYFKENWKVIREKLEA